LQSTGGQKRDSNCQTQVDKREVDANLQSTCRQKRDRF